MVTAVLGLSWFESAMIAVNVAGLSLIVVAVLFDHKRRERESTLEMLERVSDQHVKHRKAMRERYGGKRLTADQAQKIIKAASDSETDLGEIHDGMKSYFNSLERLAVGAHMGVYDLAIVDRLMNSIIVNAWRSNDEYLKRTRTDDDDEKRVYSELEEMVKQLTIRADARETSKKGRREWTSAFRITRTPD